MGDTARKKGLLSKFWESLKEQGSETFHQRSQLKAPKELWCLQDSVILEILWTTAHNCWSPQNRVKRRALKNTPARRGAACMPIASSYLCLALEESLPCRRSCMSADH